MANGRHFENRQCTITQVRINRSSPNFASRCRFDYTCNMASCRFVSISWASFCLTTHFPRYFQQSRPKSTRTSV